MTFRKDNRHTLLTASHLASTAKSQQILDGTYEPPVDTDPFMVKFLAELRMPDRFRNNQVSACISTPEHQHFWSKMSEAKGSKKTELSNAHYKASANDDLLAALDASL